MLLKYTDTYPVSCFVTFLHCSKWTIVLVKTHFMNKQLNSVCHDVIDRQPDLPRLLTKNLPCGLF